VHTIRLTSSVRAPHYPITPGLHHSNNPFSFRIRSPVIFLFL
jgi:hypothetical protein